MWLEGVKGHTTSARVETLALFDEAVHFHHLRDGSIGPPFPINDVLDLLAKGLGILRMLGQVIKNVGEGLHHVFFAHSRDLGNINRRTSDVVYSPTKLSMRIRRLRLRIDVSSPGASSINQLRKSF